MELRTNTLLNATNPGNSRSVILQANAEGTRWTRLDENGTFEPRTAALLAAAPDLLAALKALVFCMESPCPEVVAAAALFQPAITAARAAIAKARG